MFNHDRLRDQTAQTIAYLRRLDIGRSAMSYHSTRTRLWIGVLAEARAGTLAADWRSTLAVKHDTGIRDEILGSAAALIAPPPSSDADSDTLVLHELTTMPIRPWEPYAAHGNWRAALDAWYADTLAIDEYRRQPVDPLLSDHLGIADLGSRIVPGLDAMFQTLWEASYRAGLAAGGETTGGPDDDWQAWLDNRMKTQQLAASPSFTGRAANPAGLRQHLQQLPTYWTDKYQP